MVSSASKKRTRLTREHNACLSRRQRYFDNESLAQSHRTGSLMVLRQTTWAP